MSIQELERGWRSEPENEELLSELLRLYERSNLEVPLDVLASTPRWRRLSWLIATFYEEPIGVGGNTLEEIRGKEAELGVTLPKALVEWYRLVGKRLFDVVACLTRLESLTLQEIEPLEDEEFFSDLDPKSPMIVPNDAKLLSLCSAGGGEWTAVLIDSDLEDEDPSIQLCGDDGEAVLFESVASFLVGVLIDDTITAASFRDRLGPLGELKQAKCGGEGRGQAGALGKTYSSCFDFEWRLPGEDKLRFFLDHQTLMRLSSKSELTWMCVGEEAYRRLEKSAKLQEAEQSA